MIDKLTIYQGRYYKTLLGNYYPTQTDTAIPFDYEIIDPKSKVQSNIGTNLSVNEYGTSAVKTNDPLQWKVGGFVALQTGGLFQIVEVREDVGQVSRQAYRYSAIALNTEYVLRLVEVDNPRNLK